MIIKIDLRSEQGQFDIQERSWIFGHGLLPEKTRDLLREAKEAQCAIEISLKFWEGTEYRCNAMVSKTGPLFVADLVGDFRVVEPPRDWHFVEFNEEEILIDGTGIEWTNSLQNVTLRANESDYFGACLTRIFGDESARTQPTSFAVEFPWKNDEQQTRRAAGTVKNFEKSSGIVTVFIELSKAVEIQIRRRTRV